MPQISYPILPRKHADKHLHAHLHIREQSACFILLLFFGGTLWLDADCFSQRAKGNTGIKPISVGAICINKKPSVAKNKSESFMNITYEGNDGRDFNIGNLSIATEGPDSDSENISVGNDKPDFNMGKPTVGATDPILIQFTHL